jgi:hypothetical protein
MTGDDMGDKGRGAKKPSAKSAGRTLPGRVRRFSKPEEGGTD